MKYLKLLNKLAESVYQVLDPSDKPVLLVN